ncbi:MAG TPA: DMT family transporter [Rhodanobacteraceae bacterium]|nr:DMT family transporter [Rhodanobacteraceae bacterium]
MVVTRRGALAALVVLTLIWSYNWVVMKRALLFVGPFDFSMLRYLLGTLVLFAVLLARRQSLKPPPLGPTLLVGLAQTSLFQALVQWALVEGGAGKTALLAYTMPFWVVLLAWGFLSARLRLAHLLGIVIAAAGLLLVLEPWHGLGAPQSVLLALAGGLAWAIGTVASKRLFQQGRANVLSLTAWQMLFGTLGLIALSTLVPERPIEWSGYLIFAVLYNGVLSSGLCWLLWSLIVQTLPAHVAGLSSLAIPVLTVGFAWATLGERPSLVESIGIALICIALIVVNRRAKTPDLAAP